MAVTCATQASKPNGEQRITTAPVQTVVVRYFGVSCLRQLRSSSHSTSPTPETSLKKRRSIFWQKATRLLNCWTVLASRLSGSVVVMTVNRCPKTRASSSVGLQVKWAKMMMMETNIRRSVLVPRKKWPQLAFKRLLNHEFKPGKFVSWANEQLLLIFLVIPTSRSCTKVYKKSMFVFETRHRGRQKGRRHWRTVGVRRGGDIPWIWNLIFSY